MNSNTLTLSRGAPEDSGELETRPDGLPPGSLIGRFMVMDRVGEGGMGIVYSAYDPHLDRKVALKVLRPRSRRGANASRDRVLREARAMAKLAHPNVVTLYEAGSFANGVYIAMELVHGGPLSTWIDDGPHPWKEVVDRFIQAGQGLAAAHQAGLVHRDVKPANFLVKADGRVLVTDFGLVTDQPHSTPSPDDETTQSSTGAGTPAYMAPERLRGQAATVASDQFSFCVALYKALANRRPFPDGSRAQRIAAVEKGPVGPLGDRVPRWLRQATLRGLAPDPSDRHSSMRSLVDTLARRRGARKNGVAVTMGLGLLGAAGVALAMGSSDATRLCEGGDRHFDRVWGPKHHASLRDTFAATGRTHANATAQRVIEALDGQRDTWISAHRDACEATHVFGEQSMERMDQRMRCLEDDLFEVRATARILTTEVDEQVVDNAVAVVNELPDPTRCATEEMDSEGPVEADREAADDLREGIARAEVLRQVGRRPAALELLTALEHAGAASTAAEVRGLRANVRLRAGWLLAVLARGQEAEATLYAAARMGAEGDDRLLASVWTGLMYAVGIVQGRYDEALAMYPAADVLVTRAGELATQRAKLHQVMGGLRLRRADYEGALDDFTRAKALLIDDPKPLARQQLAAVMTNRGQVLDRLARYDESVAEHRAALESKRALLGPEHPEIAGSWLALGDALRLSGDLAAGLDALQRARELLDGDPTANLSPRKNVYAALGRAHKGRGDLAAAVEAFETSRALAEQIPEGNRLALGSVSLELASTYRAKGDPAQAWDALERAETTLEDQLPHDHPLLASIAYERGLWLADADRLEESLEFLREADTRLRARDEPPMDIFALVATRIDVLERLGRCAEARTLFERFDDAPSPQDRRADAWIGQFLAVRGRCKLQLAELEDAADDLHEAASLLAETDADLILAEARFDLARAYDALRRPAGERDALITQARRILADSPERAAIDLEQQIVRWLRQDERVD